MESKTELIGEKWKRILYKVNYEEKVVDDTEYHKYIIASKYMNLIMEWRSDFNQYGYYLYKLLVAKNTLYLLKIWIPAYGHSDVEDELTIYKLTI